MFLISCTGRFILKFILNFSFPTNSPPSRDIISRENESRVWELRFILRAQSSFFPNHEILERTENCFKNFPWATRATSTYPSIKKKNIKKEEKGNDHLEPAREYDARMMQEYRWSEATSYRDEFSLIIGEYSNPFNISKEDSSTPQFRFIPGINWWPDRLDSFLLDPLKDTWLVSRSGDQITDILECFVIPKRGKSK